MKITFDNVMDRVVNNRTLSRKDKLIEIRKFLKEYSGPNKPKEENEVALLASLKTLKQSYTAQDASEKLKDKADELKYN